MRPAILLSILSTLLSFTAKAQDFKRTYNWYFGDSAGVSFGIGAPIALNNGKMLAWEGCATLSDVNGSLLFYTNGESVWNKNHQIMQNGDTLYGDMSSTQAAIIVPQPDNDSLYYIFTTCAVAQAFGLRFSLINIKANGGLGKVIVKNIPLQTPVCEKLTATLHQNGKDVWVLAHGFTNNLFYAYLVTANGLIKCPVITAIGMIHGTNSTNITDAQGAMKFTKDGTRLAVTSYDEFQPYIQLFNFNKATGQLSNLIQIPQMRLTYCVEFSPNNRYLYCTTHMDDMYQFDLASNNGDTIRASGYMVYDEPSFERRHHGLQIGPDNKIYAAIWDSSYISIIEYPDSPNIACGFNLNGISLSSNTHSLAGLPNFITSYFHKPRVSYSYQRDCISDTMRFLAKDTLNRNTWNWQFKKIADGSTSASSIQNPVHRFIDTGNYEVRLIIGADTVTKTIHISPPMQVDFNLGNDTSLCDGDSLLLQPGGSTHFCFQWQDFSTAPTYMARQTGLYVATATNQDFCQVQDSIHLTFTKVPKPAIARKADTLFATTGSYTYQWYKDGSPLAGDTFAYTVRQSDGSFKVKVTNAQGCSTLSDAYVTTSVQTATGQELRIWPNPVADLLHIALPAGNETLSGAELHHLTGQVVRQSQADANSFTAELDCSALPKGLYLLKLTTNKRTYIRKVLIR